MQNALSIFVREKLEDEFIKALDKRLLRAYYSYINNANTSEQIMRNWKQVTKNNAYYAAAVKEWREKGFKNWEIRRMLLETVEYISFMVVADVDRIFEIANGERCA